jgi:hypothetical protein
MFSGNDLLMHIVLQLKSQTNGTIDVQTIIIAYWVRIFSKFYPTFYQSGLMIIKKNLVVQPLVD